MAILFLRVSDQSKYGKMQDESRIGYANKKDNYPKSVVDMVDVMRKVGIIRKKTSPSEKGKSNKDERKNLDEKSEKSSVQQKGDRIICNLCGKPGELDINCPLKQYIPMQQWYIKTGKEIYKATTVKRHPTWAKKLKRIKIIRKKDIIHKWGGACIEMQ